MLTRAEAEFNKTLEDPNIVLKKKKIRLLTKLIKHKDLQIVPTDKTKRHALVPKLSYIRKCDTMLKDKKSYKLLKSSNRSQIIFSSKCILTDLRQ